MLFKLSPTTATLTLFGLISLSQAHPAPDPDSQSANILGAASATFLKPVFDKIFGKPLLCCGEDESDCHGFEGADNGGHKYQVCYYEGDAPFLDIDAAAVKCNINLHFVQDTACISMAGSACEYSGGIMRGRMSYLTGPYQINAQESATLQAAVDAMVGKSVTYGRVGASKDISFGVLGENEVGLAPQIEFNGHQGNDC